MPEMMEWVEYITSDANSPMANLRRQNGRDQPWKVRYFGVGNESWGCGGQFTPEDYCREYRKFTEWVPRYGVDHYLIAAGPNGNNLDWTRRFFKKWTDFARAPLHAWAPHYYCGTTGHALRFSHDQAPAMDRIHDRLDKIGQQLSAEQNPSDVADARPSQLSDPGERHE